MTREYERFYREVPKDTPEWVPASSVRRVIARMYEMRCVVNGLPTVEYAMTTGTKLDAIEQLTTRYQRVHAATVAVSQVIPLAYAELRFEYDWPEKGGNPELTGKRWAMCRMAPSRDATERYPRRDLDYDTIWAKPFAAAARRVAGGKPLVTRDKAGAPPRELAGWPFQWVRKVLRQDRGEGFDIPAGFPDTDRHDDGWGDILPSAFVRDLPNLLARLQALGLLTCTGTTWSVTANGRKVSATSLGRLSRQAALKAVEAVKTRIDEINKDPKYCFRITAAVVYGSVLDPLKERLGNVDLAYDIEPRVSGKALEALEKAAIARAPSGELQTIFGRVTWPLREVQRALVGAARGIVQARRLEELARLFQIEQQPPAFQVLWGSWTPPERKSPR